MFKLYLKKNIYLYIEKILALFTDKIVCISTAERLSALKHKITREKKLNVILNGVDFYAIKIAQSRPRFELGIPDDAVIIGMVGRISDQKAPDVFLQAAKYVKKHIPNAFFMIVGDGDGRLQAETFAKENHLELYVTGWTDTPYEFMKMFDIAVLLSRWEGFGLAIVEYMAAHKNFVATRVDAIPTIVRDGVDGLLVDVDNPKQAAEAIIKLYTDKQLATSMKDNAYHYALENYDIDRVAKQHLELFNMILIDK